MYRLTGNNKKKWGDYVGEIYLIRNSKNDKKYVGATKRTVHDRKSEYKNAYNNPNKRDYNYLICEAMREIGFDNFTFEVIEECNNNVLDDREQYWISFYNTVKNGYNEAQGGKGKPLWTNKKLQACRDLYNEGWLLQDIADVFDSNTKTVSKKLRLSYNIDTQENTNINKSISVRCINDDNYSKPFISKTEAAKFLMNNGYTNNKNIASVINKIDNGIKNNSKAYGFYWIVNN